MKKACLHLSATSRMVIIGLTIFLTVLPVSRSLAGGMQSDHWQRWPLVGEAELNWFVFDIYRSQLRTPDGSYQVSSDITPHPLVLEIHYLRDITKQQLLDATDKQWQQLSLDEITRAKWIAELADIFPDIREGQQLAYVTDGQQGQFYYSVSGTPSLIGFISDQQLNDAFLAIWLSAETGYPDLRRKLIGKQK